MSASSDTQFGFNFDPGPGMDEAELIADSVEESGEVFSPILEQTFLIPELEEGAKEREERRAPEIPWTDYIHMVQLFFNEVQHEEFRELTSKLAVRYGTKSVTDTVAEAMRRAAR